MGFRLYVKIKALQCEKTKSASDYGAENKETTADVAVGFPEVHFLKRRGWIFFVLLVLALIGVYGQPILFPRQIKEPRSVDNSQDATTTTMQVKPIQAEGFASMIGGTTEVIDKQFGRPVKSYDSGYGFFVNVYANSRKDQYLEVDLIDEKIVAIKVLGKGYTDIGPFKMSMDMTDLSKITMIYPSFTIDYHDEKIGFELAEDDMNYRPLIPFDNGTYAMMFFNQNNSKLFGIMYLDKEMLLKLAPYTLVSGHPPTFTMPQDKQWEQIDRSKEEQALIILNHLRGVDKLKNYQTNFTLQGKADDLLVKLSQQPEELLGPERGELYRQAVEGTNNQIFVVVAEEFEKLTRDMKIEGTSGFVEVPVYDVMYQLMTAYSDPYLHNKFVDKEKQLMGIGIHQQNMVILIEDGQETKDSGQE